MTKLSAVLDYHGIYVNPNNESQVQADCPFCGKEQKLYGDPKSGQWDCKSCGKTGNVYTFLAELVSESSPLTEDQIQSLVEYRKSKIPTFLPEDGPGDREQQPGDLFPKAIGKRTYSKYLRNHPYLPETYLLPFYGRDKNGKIKLLNIKTLNPNRDKPRWMATKSLSQNPWVNDPTLTDPDYIYIVEGEWDGLFLTHILRKTKTLVVAIPGSGNFLKTNAIQQAIQCATNQKIPLRLIFDNDGPGRTHQEKLIKLIENNHAVDIETFQWPDEVHMDGMDLSDALLCLESPLSPEKSNEHQDNFFAKIITRSADDNEQIKADKEAEELFKDPLTFQETCEAWESTGINLTPRHKDAIVLAAATILCSQTPGVSVWLFLVGPSGCGKSLTLEAFHTVDSTFYQTSITRASLVSGFTGGGEDPSLLDRIVNQCLVIRDWTTQFSKAPQAQTELVGLLREGYDGEIDQSFGSGAIRKQHGQFGILAGVTSKIHIQQDSDVGERFIKYQMMNTSQGQDALLLHALRKANLPVTQHGADQNNPLSIRRAATKAWLGPIIGYRKKTGMSDIPISPEQEAKFVAITQWVIHCRALVERDTEGNPTYEPSTESGMRLIQQLARIAPSIAAVMGKHEVDSEVMKLVGRIAWSTATGTKREVLALVTHQGSVTVKQAHRALDVAPNTVRRYLEDLRLLDALERTKDSNLKEGDHPVGADPYSYQISETFAPYAKTGLTLMEPSYKPRGVAKEYRRQKTTTKRTKRTKSNKSTNWEIPKPTKAKRYFPR